MLIVKIMGGLGNQFFQYSIGVNLSKILNTQLLLDTSWFSTQNKREFYLPHFNCHFEIASQSQLKIAYQSMSNQKNILQRIHSFFTPKFKILHDPDLSFNPKILAETGHIYLNGYWQDERYFMHHAEVIKDHLKYKQENTLVKTIQELKSQESVCIHIRRGDYASEEATKSYHGLLPLSYYHKSIDKIIQQAQNPIFHIFSDDQKWVQKNLRLDFEHKFEYWKTCEDFTLMKHCKHFIIANSTFSWWAAWLSDNPNKIVYAPQNWFHKNNPIKSSIVPKNWNLADA